MSKTSNIIILIARVLLSVIFILSGASKLADPAGTAGMIAGAGFPAATLLTYVAGIFELVCGLSVLVGFQVRIVGWALAAFCLFTGFAFHGTSVSITVMNPGLVVDPANAAVGQIVGFADFMIAMMNQIMMMKNITMAGAYILLATVGAGSLSIDGRSAK